jgi:hypothetical protein
MQTDADRPRRVVPVIPAILAIALLALSACNPPFPAPPDSLPDCFFPPSYEKCGGRKDSAVTKGIPFSVAPQNVREHGAF